MKALNMFIFIFMIASPMAFAEEHVNFNTMIESARKEMKNYNQQMKKIYNKASDKKQEHEVAEFFDHELRIRTTREARR